MYRQFWRVIARIFIGTVLIMLLLAGCGSNAGSSLNTNGLASTSTPTIPASGSDVVTPLPARGISFHIANMYIYSSTGIECEYLYLHQIPLNLNDEPTLHHANLVLVSSPQIYDSGTIRQMRNYATAFYNENSLPPLPSPLNWLSASTQCELPMDITNTGNGAIQIQTMNIRLRAASQSNLKQYNLVDICSLEEGSNCPPQGGGGTTISYQFQLRNGSADTVFSPSTFDNPITGESSGTVSINGGDTVHIEMDFTSSSNSIYPIVPNIVLGTNNGPQTIALSQLRGTLFIAKPSQFSCYKLQGDTFVSEMIVPGPFITTCM